MDDSKYCIVGLTGKQINH